jgi:hypothetical protein
VVLDAREVRRVGVLLDVEVGLPAERVGVGAGEVLVDVRDLLLDVCKGAVEEVEALLFDGGEGFARGAQGGARVFKVLLGGLEAGFYRLEALHGAHVGVELLEFAREGGDFLLELVFEVVVGLGALVSLL